MSELAALLCDETTSEAAVYPTKALVLDTLRREHEEGSTIDPRDRVFALLIEAWDSAAAGDPTGEMAGRVETVYTSILLNFRAGTPGRLLERFVADYGLIGRVCAERGWLEPACAVAVHSPRCGAAAAAATDRALGMRTAADIAASVIQMGAIACVPGLTRSSRMREVVDACLRSLNQMGIEAVDAGREKAGWRPRPRPRGPRRVPRSARRRAERPVRNIGGRASD